VFPLKIAKEMVKMCLTFKFQHQVDVCKNLPRRISTVHSLM